MHPVPAAFPDQGQINSIKKLLLYAAKAMQNFVVFNASAFHQWSWTFIPDGVKRVLKVLTLTGSSLLYAWFLYHRLWVTRYTSGVWLWWHTSKQSMISILTPSGPWGCDNSDTFLWQLTHQLHLALTLVLRYPSDVHTHWLCIPLCLTHTSQTHTVCNHRCSSALHLA